MALKDDNDQTVAGRITSRDLGRRTIAGRTVMTGGMVDQMLDASAARAAVHEGDVFVSSQFDSQNAEHQSLLMHEWAHQDLGWGEDEAQQVEVATMVMQKIEGLDWDLEKGSDMIRQMKGTPGSQASAEQIVRMAAGDGRPREDDANGMTSYFGMLTKGLSHKEVTDQLAEWAMKQMEKAEQDNALRTGQATDE